MKLILSLLWIVFGVVCVMGRASKYESKKKLLAVVGMILIPLGLMGVAGFFLQNEKMEFFGILTPIALLLIGMPIGVIRQTKTCSVSINALYIGAMRYHSGRGNDSYAPVFRYTYNNQEYEVQTPISYSKSKVEEKYKIGSSYPVYINPDFPENCIDTLDVPSSYFMLELAGWGMLAFCIWMLFT